MLRSLLLRVAISLVGLQSVPLPGGAVTLAPGDLLAVRSPSEVVVIDPGSGAVTPIASQLDWATAAAATRDGRVYVTQTGVNQTPGIYRIDPDTGAGSLVAQTYGLVSASLAAGGDGTVFGADYGDSFGGDVRRIDASTEAVTTIEPDWLIAVDPCNDPPFCYPIYLSQTWNPLGLALSDAGDLFVLADLHYQDHWGMQYFPQGVMRVDALTGDIGLVTLAAPDLTPAVGGPGQTFAMGPDGLLYLSTTQGTAGIYRIDPLTGAVSLWLPGVTGALASDGTNLLLGTSTGLVTLDLGTGAQTTLFSGTDYQNFISLSVVSPVPEPSTALLVLAGITSLAGLHRRPLR